MNYPTPEVRIPRIWYSVVCCWAFNATARTAMDEVIKHQWFKFAIDGPLAVIFAGLAVFHLFGSIRYVILTWALPHFNRRGAAE